MPAHDLETLRTFRTELYGCFPRRADALFELGDALVAAESNSSLPHLSLQAAHRRGWGSLDDALTKGTIDGAALRATLPQDLADKQADRWTWLVVAVSTQLRLAHPWVADRRLPWERPLDPGRLTPSRVRRAVSALLPVVGTPASAPKPCGRSPGRPPGSRSGRAARYPLLKKAAGDRFVRKLPPVRCFSSARRSFGCG